MNRWPLRPSIPRESWFARATELVLAPQLFTTVAQGMRALLLALYLFLSTRLLGPSGYGEFAAAVALAVIVSSLVGLGAGVGLVRTVSRDATAFATAWGNALGKYLISGAMAAAVYVLIASHTLGGGLPTSVLCWLALTELVLNPLTLAGVYAFLACSMPRRAAALQLLPAIARLGAVSLLFFAVGNIDIARLAYALAVVTMMTTLLSLLWCWRKLPRPAIPVLPGLLKPHFDWLYSASGLSTVMTGEIDKTVAYRLAGPLAAGPYSAGSRIVTAFALPFGAIIQSRSQRLFSLGTKWQTHHTGFLRRYSIAFSAYGISVAIILTIFSETISHLLSYGFSDAAGIIVIMAWWLPLNGLRQLLGAVLVTTDQIAWRFASDLAGTLVLLIMAILFVPGRGASGVAWAMIMAEVFIMASYAFFNHRHSRKTASAASPLGLRE